MTCTVKVPMRIVNPLNNSQGFSRGATFAKAKRRRVERLAACLAMMAVRAYWPAMPVRVRLTRIAPRAFDTDGLAASFKSVRDGVADAFGLDDRDERIVWEYAQEKGAVREYAVRIEVSPLVGDAA